MHHFGRHMHVDEVSLLSNFHPHHQCPCLLFSRSKLESTILEIHMWLSHKWWQIGKHCYCQHMKSHAACWLAYLHLTLANSKGQGHAYFICEYLANGDRYGKHCYYQQIKNCIWTFHWYFHVTLANSEGQGQVMQIWTTMNRHR